MERFHYRWKLHLHNYQISLIPFFCFVLILLKLSITKSICAQFALAAYFRQKKHNFLFSGVNVLQQVVLDLGNWAFYDSTRFLLSGDMIFSSASFHKIEVVNTINYANTCKVKLCTVLNPCNCVVGLHMYYITQALYNVSVITFSTALKSVFWGDVVLFFVRAILDLWSFKLTCGLHVSFMS